MKAIGTCPNCKREDVPIEILQIGEENEFRGRCLACDAPCEGFLVLRTEPQAKAATPSVQV